MPEGFVSWELPTENERARITCVLPEEVGNLCFQHRDNTYWRLVNDTPITWEKVEA